MNHAPSLYPSSSIPPPSHMSMSLDLEPRIAEPQVQPQIIAPAETPKKIERTFTTADAQTIKTIEAPEPVVQHRKTFPKDATIDTVISPPPAQSVRPTKSQFIKPVTERPMPPIRSATSASKAGKRLQPLENPIGLFAQHVAVRPMTLILDARRVHDAIKHQMLFHVGHRYFCDAEGSHIFGLKRRWFFRKQ